MPGPPRKRDAERRRRNKDGVETIKVDLDTVLAGEIEIPAPPTQLNEETGEIEPVWHPTAELWYLSLAKSGQAIFYEPSDWTLAYLTAEQISLSLEPRPQVIGSVDGEPVIRYMVVPMPGATLSAVIKVHGQELMGSEGGRRKLRIELDRKKRQDEALSGGNVVPISQTRQDRFTKAVQK